jgi:ferritin-like metal-binding protein YciE
MSDLLSAEQQFSKALTKVKNNAVDSGLKELAARHFDETQQHIENLRQAFEILGEKPEKMVCKGAQGICEENDSTIKEEKPKGNIKDLVLLSGSIRVEHYEIAGYSAAIALAKALKKREVVQLLQANLKQEQATAKILESATNALLNASNANGSASAAAAA